LEETFQQFMQVFISSHKSTKASIWDLETHISQLAQKLEEKLIIKI